MVCEDFFISTKVGPAAHDHPVQISTFFAVFVLGEIFFLYPIHYIFDIIEKKNYKIKNILLELIFDGKSNGIDFMSIIIF